MNAADIARVFHAKRAGKGKWRGICPIHGGKYSGPLSITQMGDGVRVHCFGGCETKDVMAAVNLTCADLQVYKTPDPFWQQKRSEEDRLALLETRHCALILLIAIDPDNRCYWDAAERNVLAEIERIRPDKQREVRRIIEEYGIPELMECVDPHWEIDDSGPHNLHLIVCDSDSEGAFKVYRRRSA